MTEQEFIRVLHTETPLTYMESKGWINYFKSIKHLEESITLYKKYGFVELEKFKTTMEGIYHDNM